MGIDLVQVVLMRHGAGRKVTCPDGCARRRRAACSAHPATGLTARAFKVLVRMAATALDKPTPEGRPPRLYFAGEGPLISVLYGPAAGDLADRAEQRQELTEAERRELKNMRREVRAAVDELRTAGLIVPQVDHARTGNRQRFHLTLGLVAEGQSAHPAEGQSAHPAEGQSAPTDRGNMPTPRKETGEAEDSSEDGIPHPCAPSTDRAHDAPRMDGIRLDPNEPHDATGRLLDDTDGAAAIDIGDRATCDAFEPDDSGLSCGNCGSAYNRHARRTA